MPNQDTGDDDTDEPSHFLFPGLRHRLHNPHGWSSSTSSSDNVAIGDIDAQVPHRRRNQRQLQQPDVNVPSSSRDPYAQPPGHRVTRAQHATQNDRRGFYGLFGLATPMGSDVDYSDVQLSIRSLPRRPPVDLHAQPSLARTYRFVASGIGPGAHQVANQSGRRDVLYTVSGTLKNILP
jgi:hypothetical protein